MKPRYINSVKNRNEYREFFNYKNIVILGTGYYGRFLASYLLKKMSSAPALKRKITMYTFIDSQEGTYFQNIPIYKLDVLFHKKQDEHSLLCIALEHSISAKLLKQLFCAGFDKVVNAVDVVSNTYNPLFFRVTIPNDRIAETTASSEDIAKKLDKEVQANLPGEAVSNAYFQSVLNEKSLNLQNGQKSNAKNCSNHDLNTELDYVNSLEQALVLNYLGRSGSIYLSTLLDNNRGLLLLPPGMVYYPETHLTELFLNQDQVTVQDIVDCYQGFQVDDYQRISLTFEDGGSLFSEEYFKKFQKVFYRLLSQEAVRKKGILTERFLIQASHYAHAYALGFKYSAKEARPYIVYNPHTPDIGPLSKMIYLFPLTLQMLTARDTLRSLISSFHCAYCENGNKLTIQDISYYLDYYSHNMLLSDPEIIKRTLVVRLEDLNSHLEKSMDKIKFFLGLDRADHMMENTILGRKVQIQYHSNTQSSSIKINSKYLMEDYISAHDEARLRWIFHKLLVALKYSTDSGRTLPEKPLDFREPFRFESKVEDNMWNARNREAFYEPFLQTDRDAQLFSALRILT